MICSWALRAHPVQSISRRRRTLDAVASGEVSSVVSVLGRRTRRETG